jgi:hypothetical protein
METVLIFKTSECITFSFNGISEPESLTYRLAFLFCVLRFKPNFVIDNQRYADGRADLLTCLAARLVVVTPRQAVCLNTSRLCLQFGGNNR